MLILDITKMSLKFKHDEGPEDLMPKVSGRTATLFGLPSHIAALYITFVWIL